MKIQTHHLNYGRAFRSELCTLSGSVIVTGRDASSEHAALICLRAEISRWAAEALDFVQKGIDATRLIG